MVRNNSGRLGWKVNLTPSQIRNNLAVEIWKKKYQVDYALLDTWEEKINFLKGILGKNRGKGSSSNEESQEALQVFIVNKLNYARDQQANESTVKGQKSPEPIQKNNSDSEPGSTKQIHNEKINWQGTQSQLVYIWDELFAEGFLNPLEEKHKWQLLAQYFVVKGNLLDPEKLRGAFYSLRNNDPPDMPAGGQKINSIIKNTKSRSD